MHLSLILSSIHDKKNMFTNDQQRNNMLKIDRAIFLMDNECPIVTTMEHSTANSNHTWTPDDVGSLPAACNSRVGKICGSHLCRREADDEGITWEDLRSIDSGDDVVMSLWGRWGSPDPMAIKLAAMIALRLGVLVSYEESLAGRLKRMLFGFGGNK